MRIAHFSDLHVLSLAGVKPHQFLNKRLSGYANLRFKRNHIHRPAYVRSIAREISRAKVDHVCITGDLTNLALAQEFEAARALLEEGLELEPRHVSIVPGNHDLYTRGALRAKRFSTYFAKYIESDLPELGVDIGLGQFPYVKLRGRCAIIGLSSAVPRLPFVASGKLGRLQLDALGRILEHREVKARTPIVLLHHPAHNPHSRLKTMLEGLWDADDLAHHLRGIDHGLVLHGHLHKRQQRPIHTRNGKMHAVGATSASLHHEHDAKMAGFNLYEIDDGEGHVVRIEAHVLDPERDAFTVVEVPISA